MSEETTSQEEAQAATPEIVAAQPETTPVPVEEKKEAEEVKSFTQAELDKIIQSEKAKAEAKAERRAMKAYKETLERLIPQPQAKQEAPADTRPTQSQYANVDDYVEAMADWKLQQREQVQQRAQAQERNQTLNSRTESIYAEAEKLPGFDREAFDELPLTQHIAAAILDSDVPAKVMAFMAANPDEVARISSLSPARQAAEIGKLEVKVSSIPKVSNAPAPLKPVGARGNATGGDPSRMSMEEYQEYRAKQGARWARR
jgi:dynactin complex subunit